MLLLLVIISDIFTKKHAIMLCSTLNLGHIYGNDLQNGKWTWDLALGITGVSIYQVYWKRLQGN